MLSCIEARKRAGEDLRALVNTPAWEHIRTCNNYECLQLWRKLNRAVNLSKEKCVKNVNLMLDEDGLLPFSQ